MSLFFEYRMALSMGAIVRTLDRDGPEVEIGSGFGPDTVKIFGRNTQQS